MAQRQREFMEVKTIDYVVPMVFHNDKLWQEDFMKVNSRFDETNPYDFVRFRSWGTEHHLIRCVKKFMPFVRTIYIILARESQKQPWMDEEDVRVVYHRDFIQEKFLPTFNSCAIEMFLYLLPDLSERFIYGNDDVFPLTNLRENDFFEGDIPCLMHGIKPYPLIPNIFHRSCQNGQMFVAKEFGVDWSNVLVRGGHSLTPMLKSTWEYLWRIGKSEIENSVSPFRESKNFNQWLCPWWHYLSGDYIDKVPQKSYVSTKNSVEEVVKAINDCKGLLCINDNECENDYMKYGRAVIEAIENKLNS